VAAESTTSWRSFQWNAQGAAATSGTLERHEINLDAVRPAGPGELRLGFGHVKFVSGEWVIELLDPPAAP
jgi:hypothetical protein